MLDSKKTYALIFCAALAFFILSLRPVTDLSSVFLDSLRILSGFLTCFFSAGFLISLIVFKKYGKTAEAPFVFIAGIFLSCLLTYPLAIMNILIEGQNNYYQYRLHRIAGLYFLIICVLTFVNIAYAKKVVFMGYGSQARKIAVILAGIIILNAFTVFCGINAHDLCGDEINIGMRSYDLVDGNVARRKAYFLSTVSHSPLINTAGFVSMQILQPSGLYELEDWMFRFLPALVSIMISVCLFFILYPEFGILPAFAAALLLSVSNYHAWMGRILLREGLMTFMLSFGVLSAFRIKRGDFYIVLCALALGAAFLAKFTAVFFAAPFFIYVYLLRKNRVISFSAVLAIVCLPVILFNVAAYITTGYMDQPFGKLFNMLGGAAGGPMTDHDNMYTGLVNPFKGFADCVRILLDQSGIILFSLILISFCFVLAQCFKEKNKDIFLVLSCIAVSTVLFVFNGVRAYYLYPVFFFMISAVGIAVKYAAGKRIRYLFFGFVFIGMLNSVLILLNTQYGKLNKYRPAGVFNAATGDELPQIDILKPVSYTTLLWLKSGNMKAIRQYMRNNITEDDLVVVDDDIYVLDYCWYIKKKALMLDDGNYLAYRKNCHIDKIQGEPTIIWQSKFRLYRNKKFRFVFLVTDKNRDSAKYKKEMEMRGRYGDPEYFIYKTGAFRRFLL
ncbi:MAG: glycosyltransferase family 39 protein [bacterium]|nr:glycosyltransferase family 39 protein [bacterium]